MDCSDPEAYIQSKGHKVIEGGCCPEQVKWFGEYLKTHTDVINILEIGFNCGAWCNAVLSVRPDIKITSVDIGVWADVVRLGKEYIDLKYPGRHTIHIGDSTIVVPTLSGSYDMIFIDGGHHGIIPYTDMNNCKRLAHPNTVVICDDWGSYHGRAVFRGWAACKKEGLWKDNGYLVDYNRYNGRRLWWVGRYNFKKVLFITGYNRTEIMGQQLEALNNCDGIEDWIVCYHQDGLKTGGADELTEDIAHEWLDKLALKTEVHKYIYTDNKFIAIRQMDAYQNALYQHNADVVACFEDDLIPCKSYLTTLTNLISYSWSDPTVGSVGGNYKNRNLNCDLVNGPMMSYQINWGSAHARHKLEKILNIWKPAFYEIFVKPDGITPEPFKPDFDRYNRVFDKYGLERNDCWCQDILQVTCYQKMGYVRTLYPNARYALPRCSEGITSNRHVFDKVLGLDEITPDWQHKELVINSKTKIATV
jgi:hypothetical protein